MNKLSLTLSGLLLASTAMIAPSLSYAQTPPPATSAASAEEALEAQQDPQDEVSDVDEIVVLGRFIPQPMRETSEVAAFLTDEDIQRTGDSNAAEALTRVTGLTIVEGRFIYVRGLGERYSSALLNGSPLPSPEPLQRVIPLDLFPANVLGGVTVQKTYSVNYPGEFGGGVIDLQTVRAPNDPFFTMKASVGGNTETTGEEGLLYFGSRTDFTGFDDGTRSLPGPLALAFASGNQILAGPNYDDEALQDIGQSLVNSPLRLLQRETTPANFGLEFTGGTSMETGFGTLGVIAVAGYDNSWRGRRGVEQVGQIDAGVLQTSSSYDFESNQNDIRLNFLGGLSLETENHEITWTNFYIRNVTKEARAREGFDGASGSVVRNENLEWFERQLFSTQLAGEHSFLDSALDFSWRAAYAKTSRDAPYETSFNYNQLASGVFAHNIQQDTIGFGQVDDDVVSGGADVSYTLPLSDARDAIFSAGVAYYDNNRDTEQRLLHFIAPNGLTADQLVSRVDYLYSDFNINPTTLQIEEITGTNGAGAYTGQLEVSAIYAQVDAEIIPLVRATVGVRYEDGQQSVVPFDLFGGASLLPPTSIDEQYYLPAATLTWNFAEDQQLRLGASKTIGRPQFRELSPLIYNDQDSDRSFIGNPFLTNTELMNYDIRYEWYFARGQYLTAGLFYKDLENPVESVTLDLGSSVRQSYLNAPRAIITGAEFEVKKYFEFPDSGMSFIANKRWLFQANYTFSDSEIQVGAGDTVRSQTTLGLPVPAAGFVVDGSRLQGQSDHVANLQLGWEDDTARSQATFIVNYVSERSTSKGRPGEPDLIQDPGVFLDFVYRKDFEAMGHDLGLAVELQNLLGTDFDESQQLGGPAVQIRGYDIGTSGSLSLTARF